MTRFAVAVILALVLAGAACDTIEPSGAAPTEPPSNGTPAPVATTTAAITLTMPAFEPGATVPDANDAGLGCVDEAGSIRAPAGEWYHSGALGQLSFTGEFVTTDKFVDFTNAIDDAVSGQLQAFTAEGATELAADASACVTYRSVQFQGDDEATLIVAVWRVEGATDPYWVPNERDFALLDDATLVSDGEHIRVALVVAADGTTVRVSSYGVHAIDSVAGWPSTVTVATDRQPGQAPGTAQQLIAIGREVLSYALAR